MSAKIGEFRNVKSLFAADRKETEELLIRATRDIPFEPVEGDGAIVRDRYGNEYLDFHSFVGTANVGHGRIPVLWQPGKILNALPNDFLSVPARQLAEKLIQITPIRGDKKKVLFRSSGTQAVEAALKLSMAHHHFNPRESQSPFCIGHFTNSFHGRTLGSLSITDSKREIRRKYFPVLDWVLYVPIPFPQCFEIRGVIPENASHDRCWNSWHEELERTNPGFMERVHELHVLFMELVQGEGGINPICPRVLDYFAGECAKEGVVIVVDEVQTGIGRTGEMFACDAYGFKPDIITMAKSLALGMPLSAVVANIEYDEDGLDADTFGGFTLAAQVALSVLDAVPIELERLKQENSFQIIEQVLSGFDRTLVRDVRGLGMMFGFDIEGVRGDARRQLIDRSLEQGLVLIGAGRNAIRVMPPLAITKEELEMGLDIMENVIQKLS
ncbi:aminotransferase class III-fold pyridoxal phosphate-dependent enzyme [Candidatus Jorgensenbacteria bacterium]|nr:aminotransferase class III-fold pyridoxal phosphate-dependent enzyme [Candidatus Jorgensenbacteria bacterium]